jgi:hypothetical protein
MWHLGIKKDATLILLVGIFILLSVVAVLLVARLEDPPRCTDPFYNPATVTHKENL